MKKQSRYFWGSFSITLCLILFFCGMVTADYHTRWIGFGNDQPVACVVETSNKEKKLQINLMGLERSYDVSKSIEFAKNVNEYLIDTAKTVSNWLKEVHF